METITGKNLKIGDVLIEQGYITENQMLQAMAAKMDCQVVNIDNLSVDIVAVGRIPRQAAEKYGILAVGSEGGRLKVVVNDPLNFYGLEDVR